MKLIIIQARMGSTRCPGKVLHEVLGKPYLIHMVNRLKRCTYDRLLVATSLDPQNDLIETVCNKENIDIFRGSEDDVIDRYLACARKYNANIIVRVTADCPLIVPEIVDDVAKLLANGLDYASLNTPPHSRTYPDGCDVEVFTIDALERANLEVNSPLFREHLTFQFWQDPSYKIIQYPPLDKDLSNYRITVDYPEDIEVVDFIFNTLYKTQLNGSLNQIIRILDDNPGIFSRNAHYNFGQGWKL